MSKEANLVSWEGSIYRRDKFVSNAQKRVLFKNSFDQFDNKSELTTYLRRAAKKKLISVDATVQVIKDYRTSKEKS